MIIYDIECFINFFSITLKKDAEVYKYVLFNNQEIKMSKSDVINLIKGETLAGFNNKSYDDILLDFFIENNATNNDLKILNDAIIDSPRNNTNKLRKRFLINNPIYNSIDLYERSPLLKSSLKKYEHYKRMNNISETPISFEDTVEEKDIELILKYNEDDVIATEVLYNEVKPLLDSLDDLAKEYKISKDLKSLSSGQIVDNFFRDTIKPESVPEQMIVDLKQNIDFEIKNELVKSHLDKLQNYPVKTYDAHRIKSELLKKNDIITDDIINDCDTNYEADILNAKIRFGVGGAHSDIESLDLKSDDIYTIIDCDVNGMYPNIIVKQQIAPFYYSNETKLDFFKTYSEVIEKRNTLKAQGSHLEESYKLILNTLTGKFKEPFSVLYDPTCHIKTCIYGQYFIFSILEQCEQYTEKICQINTDGFTLYIKRENLKYIEEILNNTKQIKWKIKHFKKFVSKDCNNYVALTSDDEIKSKGSTFNLKTYNLPQVLKTALIDNLLFDRDVETTIRNTTDLYDFLYLANSTKGSITIDDVEHQGKLVRFFKSKNGHTIKSNGKQMSNAENVILQNEIDQSKLSEVDFDFYINEVYKLINNMRGFQHTEVIDLFAQYNIKLCGKTGTTPDEDGVSLFKGNTNKGENLSAYETVGIDMFEHPDLLYIDIDHIDNNHRIMIDLCKNANTIYSTSDLHTDSYRFFFKNNSDIQGQYVWLNQNKETSFEIWNQVKNKVSVSGVKKKQYGEVIERYIVQNDTLQMLTPEIIDWVKNNPPDKIKKIDKTTKVKKEEVQTIEHDDDMTKLFNLIKDKYQIKTKIVKNEKVIGFKKPPTWYIQTGGWRDGTLTLFAKSFKDTFDVNIVKKTESFTDEDTTKLYDELKPFIDQINREKAVSEFESVITDMIENNQDDEDIINDDPAVNSPLISKEVYDNLPKLLKEMCDMFTIDREKDVFLTAALSVLSCMFEKSGGFYNREMIYSNIMTLIIANAASGKSAAKFAIELLDRLRIEIHNDYQRELLEHTNSEAKTAPPTERKIQIGGNASASKLARILEGNKGNGIIAESEADTIVEAFKKDWGNYDEILRKVFQHEWIQIDRQTYTITIDKPKLSVMLTGTPDQMLNLIKSSQNGLFSRFIYYIYKPKETTPEDEFGDMFSDDDIDFGAYFKEKSNEVYDMHKYYLDNPFILKVNEEQRVKFRQYFITKVRSLKIKHEDGILASIRRLGTTGWKLLIILSALRNYNNKNKSRLIYVNDIDLKTMFGLIDVYTAHMEIVFVNLSTSSNIVIKANPREKLINFILSQKGKFKRDLINTQAANLNISSRSVDSIISSLKKDGKLLKEGKLLFYVNK